MITQLVLVLIGVVALPFLRIALYAVLYLLSKKRYSHIPKVPGHNFISLKSVQGDDYLIRLYNEVARLFPNGTPPLLYGGPFLLSSSPVVLVNDAACIRTVSNDKLFPKVVVYDHLHALLGTGLVTAKGAFWEHQREIINPWFHSSKIKAMAEGAMLQNCDELVSKLEQTAGKPANVVEIMGELTQKVLIDSMFSGRVDAHWAHQLFTEALTSLNLFVAGSLFLGWINDLPIFPWTRSLNKANRLLCGRIKELIEEAKQKQADPNEIGDFIEHLVTNNVDDKQIYSECMTMLFAGHDTTKNTLSWLLYFLGQNPDYAQLMQEEIDTVLKGAAPSYEDYNKLKITRNAVLETLRLRGPAPGVDRYASEDCTLAGVHIPKGTLLTMNFYACLYDAKNWKDPTTFYPERFNEDLKYTTNFVPFSVGPRGCIGQKFALTEAVLVITTILQNFDVHLCTEYPVKPAFEGTLTPTGLRCKFIKRMKM